MKEQLAEIVVETIPSRHSSYQLQEEDTCALQVDFSTPGGLERQRTRTLDKMVIGTLVGFKDSGAPLIHFPANISGEPLPARATVTLSKGEVGRQVVLMFEDGDPQKPIVMGLVQDFDEGQYNPPENSRTEKQSPILVEVDGERIVLTAAKELVLRCGEASITLTRAGKVLIRGTYLLSRSSGVNCIKGGSVQIN
jgi:hypothetical protein